MLIPNLSMNIFISIIFSNHFILCLVIATALLACTIFLSLAPPFVNNGHICYNQFWVEKSIIEHNKVLT